MTVQESSTYPGFLRSPNDSYEATYFGINILDGERYEIIMDCIPGI